MKKLLVTLAVMFTAPAFAEYVGDHPISGGAQTTHAVCSNASNTVFYYVVSSGGLYLQIADWSKGRPAANIWVPMTPNEFGGYTAANNWYGPYYVQGYDIYDASGYWVATCKNYVAPGIDYGHIGG